MFPDEDPIGHRLAFPPEQQKDLKGPQIVGVYRHFTHLGLDDPGPVRYGMIFPYALVAQFVPQWGTDLVLVVRGEGDPQALAGPVRREVLASIGGVPDVPLMEDFELCRRLRRCGRLALADATVVTSARRFQKLGVLRTYFRMAGFPS